MKLTEAMQEAETELKNLRGNPMHTAMISRYALRKLLVTARRYHEVVIVVKFGGRTPKTSEE